MEMENCYGQHGWKAFNSNRKDILSALDNILEKIEDRPVKTAHGNAVEAYIRGWLSDFLPKKYGVTSGYIIPDLYDDSLPIYHYDIIIYNQLEAPILWTEGNRDQSEQGKYRAIPAKHIIAVYEVKSRLTKKNVSDAFDKLSKINELRQQLHSLYSCGLVFIDLKESDNNDESIIKELIKGKDIFRFNGGVVLRYEKDHSLTGIIKILNHEPKDESENKANNERYKPIAKIIDDLNFYLTEDGALQIASNGGGAKLVTTANGVWSVAKMYGISYDEDSKSVHLNWSRTNFSDFCMDLLRELEGLKEDDRQRPIFGQVFDKIERKKTPRQSETPEKGKPFLIIKSYEGGVHGDKLTINPDSITCTFSIENKGEETAILSDDSFKTKCELLPGKTAVRTFTLQVGMKNPDKSLKEFLDSEGLEFTYRAVYYPANTNKEFVSIEAKVKIIKNEIKFLLAS